jgi:putative ATPase
LPAEIAGTIYYQPSQNGYEAKVTEWLKKRRKQTGDSATTN